MVSMEPLLPHDDEGPIVKAFLPHREGLLAGACVCAIFTGILNVPETGFLWPALFLGFAVRAGVGEVVSGTILLTMCLGLGSADLLHYEVVSRAESWAAVVGLGLLQNSMLLAAIAVQRQLWMRYPECAFGALAFPTVWTGLWQLWVAFTPLGTVGLPITGLALLPAVRQLVALGGWAILLFGVAWAGSVAVGFLLLQRVSRAHVWAVACAWAAALAYGGLRVGLGRGMWLDEISVWPAAAAMLHPAAPPVARPTKAATLQVSCISGGYGNYSLQWALERTRERLAAGDDFILWSEMASGQPLAAGAPDALPYPADGPTFDVVHEALAVLQLTNSTGRPAHAASAVVGIAYPSAPNGRGLQRNTLSLIQADRLLGTWEKARPVPFLEVGIERGRAPPSPIEVDFGGLSLMVAGAICFDFDFPDVIRTRCRPNAHFMPQPAAQPHSHAPLLRRLDPTPLYRADVMH